ncbi:hypothetical protein GCM10010306_060750 [Streptomyces umbrinus]|uniref:dihydrodiol dehydrogenase n=1 Tax=Streptomyces umbrinus TaxID=67370 RepID=UPI001676F884|nr:dihydrodiol dehydrogenase [Streptomyces umbrinus]GHB59093.1 hypothetical protein GCM10010306_060750 [Streptomyces umbrinus]
MAEYEDSDGSDDPTIEIINEFAYVRVRRVYTRNGERLEIVAPRRGYRILLDAVELESLTWQNPETFSGFLRASIGRDVGEDESGVS